MNKISFDWRNHLTELVVVFIGIYGAFALNNWNESRQEREQENKYLTNIYSEIQQDIKSLELLINNATVDSSMVDSLIKILRKDQQNFGNTLPLVASMSEAEQFYPRKVTFESIKNSGGLEKILNFELRKIITENYLQYDNLILVEKVVYDFLTNYWIPYSMLKFDILNIKVRDVNFIYEIEFKNLVAGYFILLKQQLSSYRKTLITCNELQKALKTEIE